MFDRLRVRSRLSTGVGIVCGVRACVVVVQVGEGVSPLSSE
jgi:hypothetical protein